MKKFVTLLTLILSYSALAREQVSITLPSFQGGSTIHYHCSFVEDRAQQLLRTMGATDIDVHCMGGLSGGMSWPASVTADFNLPVLSGREEARKVTLTSDPFSSSCFLNVGLMRPFLKKFKNISVLEKDDFCAYYNSSWFYKLSIQR